MNVLSVSAGLLVFALIAAAALTVAEELRMAWAYERSMQRVEAARIEAQRYGPCRLDTSFDQPCVNRDWK